jgi:sucrose-phosphate synthase
MIQPKPFIQLFSLHGLVRGRDPELGRDADTGGQVLYVLELARALGRHPGVGRVELVTRLIDDPAAGPAYAAPEEHLGGNAYLVRLPFGGPGYLRKEALWPHLDELVEQVLARIERTGRVPDVLHGHYADGGAACTRLAERLGRPMLHTGHSLGRTKRAQLLAAGHDPLELERSFCLERRIREEERTFERAAAIVASTAQERTEQYGDYEADVAAKIRVIPPGVDVERFQAYDECYEPAVVGKLEAEIGRFLSEPAKPMILAISRPAQKKNLAALVHAYGADPDLQAAANLVIFAGTRDDIASMPPNEAGVLAELLMLKDRYDLYGRMAVPKAHDATSDVPVLYRMAARSGGVFVNPALTEPFGLTLLEAAASGLPVLATEEGGPPDIIAACRNGLVVPPLDPAMIARGIHEIIGKRERWQRFSRAGIAGVRRHYAWDAHVERYLELVADVRGQAVGPARARTFLACVPAAPRLLGPSCVVGGPHA